MKKIMKAALLVMALCLILTGCQYLPEIPFLPTEPTVPTEHVHTLIHMKGYEATCTVNGIIENWSCLECGKRFADAEATKEITFADIEIIAKHSYDEGVVTAPTCTEGGYTTYTCTVCGDSYKADAVDATGHTPEEGSGVVTNPTCTEGGYTTYTCTVCGESYKADATEPSGHTMVDVEAKDATCTEDGYTAHKACACGETEGKEVAPATGHTAGAAATCTDPQICTVCKVELAPATGHTAGAAATCTDPQICTVCQIELAPATGHTAPNADAKCDNCGKFCLPEVGTAFKLTLFQNNKGAKYYFTGAMSGYYFATNTDISKAVDVYLEEAEGGYYMYFMSGETKNYIYGEKASNGKFNIKFGATKSVWTYDYEMGIFKTVVSGTTFYMGTYGTYVTINISKISYINASNVDKEQFAARPVVVAAAAE